MSDVDNIPTSELFADLQVTLTEIFLIELLDNRTGYTSRLDGNHKIKETIKGIMHDRFSHDDIEKFLEYGYPRRFKMKDMITGQYEEQTP